MDECKPLPRHHAGAVGWRPAAWRPYRRRGNAISVTCRLALVNWCQLYVKHRVALCPSGRAESRNRAPGGSAVGDKHGDPCFAHCRREDAVFPPRHFAPFFLACSSGNEPELHTVTKNQTLGPRAERRWGLRGAHLAPLPCFFRRPSSVLVEGRVWTRFPAAMTRTDRGIGTRFEGLTLAHLSAQLERFVWERGRA